MNLWHRHLVLQGKARREGRLGHRHRWWKRGETFGNTVFSCWCGKRITERQIVAAGMDDSWELFLPIVEEQRAFLWDTRFFHPS